MRSMMAGSSMLAPRIDIELNLYREIENGVMLPNLVTLLRIAGALPCKVSELTSVFDNHDVSKLVPK